MDLGAAGEGSEGVRSRLISKLEESRPKAPDLSSKARAAESAEKALWLKTAELLEGFSRIIKRVKVEGAGETFADLQSTFVDLQASRDRTNREWRVLTNAERARADTHKAEYAISELFKQSERKVLGAITKLSESMATMTDERATEQQGQISNLQQQLDKANRRPINDGRPAGSSANLASKSLNNQKRTGISQSTPETRLEEGQNKASSNMDHQEEAWSKVVKRRQAKTATDAKAGKQQPRPRPPAIMVDVGVEDFPALAMKIRSGVNREITGSHVTAMRQARSGGLLIEVRGDSAQVEAVRAEVARSAGP